MATATTTPTDPLTLAMEVEDIAAEWRRRQASTEPADRARAEAAIRRLYVDRQFAAPDVLWVPSPRAGAVAYLIAAHGRRTIEGQRIRGERGSGRNRTWNALADPFDMESRWLESIRTRIQTRLAEPLANRILNGELFAVGHRMLPAIDSLLRRPGDAPPRSHSPYLDVPDDAAAERLGRGMLGEAWDRYESLVGRELLLETISLAVGDTARSMLETVPRERPWHVRPEDQGLLRALQAMQPGQFDTIAPMLDVARRVLKVVPHGAQAAARNTLARCRIDLAASAGPWWALRGQAIVCERPVLIATDPAGRPHSDSGPAVAWPDGSTIWARHGVEVPEWVVTRPESIDLEAIMREGNVETRRAMTERIGWERIAREDGARLVHEDTAGKLWEMVVPLSDDWPDRNARFVEVENTTPEPDGSRRHYFIRVPPHIQTARAAVAWTFELGEAEYRPMAES